MEFIEFWVAGEARLSLLLADMNTANIHYAKTHLSALLAKIAIGEEIIIAKSEKPLPKLSPLEPTSKKRVPGLDRGLIKVSDDFDEEDEAINKMFYGDAEEIHY